MLEGSSLRFSYRNWLEDRLFDLAWLLPRSIVEACFVRVVAHSTTGEYAGRPAEISCSEALRRWDTRKSKYKGLMTIGDVKEVVDLAGLRGHPTMTWHYRDASGPRDGMIHKGQHLAICQNMHITAVHTGSA